MLKQLSTWHIPGEGQSSWVTQASPVRLTRKALNVTTADRVSPSLSWMRAKESPTSHWHLSGDGEEKQIEGKAATAPPKKCSTGTKERGAPLEHE